MKKEYDGRAKAWVCFGYVVVCVAFIGGVEICLRMSGRPGQVIVAAILGLLAGLWIGLAGAKADAMQVRDEAREEAGE